MYCKNCGKEIADDSKHCEYCGADLNAPHTNIVIEDNSGSKIIKYLVIGAIVIALLTIVVYLIFFGMAVMVS